MFKKIFKYIIINVYFGFIMEWVNVSGLLLKNVKINKINKLILDIEFVLDFLLLVFCYLREVVFLGNNLV